MADHFSRLLNEEPCDCAACVGFRLATRLFIAGVIALLIVAILIHSGEPKPLLIDASVSKADYPRCITVRPGPIRPRPRQLPYGPQDDEA